MINIRKDLIENELQVFKNAEFGSVRTTTINGEPFFVGKDVAGILGYSNGRKALIDHVDAEDKGVTKCDTLGGMQELTVINESGLYSLILSSKLPNAKKFKHWVTAEVLPTIRKTGGYVNNDELFVNTYLPFADQQTKSMFWQTLRTIRTQNGIIAKQKEELEYKQEVINGFCDVDIYTKRTVICRICKKNANNNFATRWGELYNCFREIYHIDLPIRKDSYNIGKSKKDQCSSIIDYAEKFGHIDNLYKCCVSLYESETNDVLQQILDAKDNK
jgi:prophage antirepressor-like protein